MMRSEHQDWQNSSAVRHLFVQKNRGARSKKFSAVHCEKERNLVLRFIAKDLLDFCRSRLLQMWKNIFQLKFYGESIRILTVDGVRLAMKCQFE